MDKGWLIFILAWGFLVLAGGAGWYVEWLVGERHTKHIAGEIIAIVLIALWVAFFLGVWLSNRLVGD
jgi:hypothetical protein